MFQTLNAPNDLILANAVCDFKPILLEHLPYFQQVLSNLKAPTTDYSFVNLYPYTTPFNLMWASIDRHLCIFMKEDGLMHMILPPLPEEGASLADLKSALQICFKTLNAHNCLQGSEWSGTIQTVSDELLEKIKLCGLNDLIITPSYVSGDFIYEMQKMITLSGSSLSSKRYARNKFVKDFPNHRTAPLSPADIPTCLQLLDCWGDNKQNKGLVHSNDEHELIYRQNEKAACETALTLCQEFKMKGMTLFVEDQLVGFTLGEALTPTQVSIVFEKTHPDFDGSSAYIFSEFCRLCWSDFKECNAGDDANNPSLRFTKEHYRPIRMLNKYILSRSAPSN